MADRTQSHGRAVWTALLVTALWSSSWVLIRKGLDNEELPPITFAGLRYTLAAVVLLVWALGRPTPRRELLALDRSLWRPLVILGIAYYAVTQGAQFVAIDSQPAATSSLMLTPTALLVAILSRRSIGEPVDRRQVIGAALIVAGAVVYFSGDLGATAVGMTASVIGLAANVSGALLGRSINRGQRLSPLTVTVASMTVGAAILLVSGLVAEGWPSLSGRAVVVIVWLAVVNTAWAFTLWNASLRRLSALESATINNTMLIQIAILGWVFLGEPPGWVAAIGIVVVFCGALLAQGIRRSPATRRLRSTAAE